MVSEDFVCQKAHISGPVKQEGRSLLSTGQAAKLCSVTPDTILKWIKRGRIDGIRTAGGHYRVRSEDLWGILRGAPEDEPGPPRVPGPLRCWEYFSVDGVLRDECKDCVVRRVGATQCFHMATLAPELGHAKRFCRTSCEDCVYYRRVKGLAARVLVVTNDDVLAGRLKMEPQDERVTLRLARSSYEASAILQYFQAGFALVDGDTIDPDRDGLLDSLSRDPRVPGLKIVMALSRAGAERRRGKAAGKGVAAVIEKPFGMREVLALVEDFSARTNGAQGGKS